MGLFWIRPESFINLDSINRAYLKIKLPTKGLNAKFYIDTVRDIAKLDKPFPKLSLDAFFASQDSDKEKDVPLEAGKLNYWLVGAYWDESDPSDQSERFIAEGIWMNGWEDRYLDEVKSMQVGDKISIKAAATQRIGLPFDGKNKTVSRMDIKAIGTIVANRKDGRTVEVEWDPDFQEKSWYFYTARGTVWHVKPVNKKVWTEAADQLINFVWYGHEQNYDWFIHQWWDSEKPPKMDEGKRGGTSFIR